MRLLALISDINDNIRPVELPDRIQNNTDALQWLYDKGSLMHYGVPAKECRIYEVSNSEEVVVEQAIEAAKSRQIELHREEQKTQKEAFMSKLQEL